MQTHTAGPWKTARIHPDPETNKSIIQIFPEGDTDCAYAIEIAIIYCARDGSTGAANAHLIAAAPTMYDYIKDRAELGDIKAKSIIDSLL